jgi:hypothetical protein
LLCPHKVKMVLQSRTRMWRVAPLRQDCGCMIPLYYGISFMHTSPHEAATRRAVADCFCVITVSRCISRKITAELSWCFYIWGHNNKSSKVQFQYPHLHFYPAQIHFFRTEQNRTEHTITEYNRPGHACHSQAAVTPWPLPPAQ